MKLSELKILLSQHPNAQIRLLLPNGEFIPAHAHVTEAARIDKKFVDCGGTFREDSYCRLQTWVADDVDHRLTAGKLFRILHKAHPVLRTEELEVDIEHEVNYISQFPLGAVEATDAEVILKLSVRHTACLAVELCCPTKSELIKLGGAKKSGQS